MNVTYDEYGRMNYCPELHTKRGEPWTQEDLDYLKEWYSVIGPEEMSFALERPVKAIMTRASSMGIKVVGNNKRLKKEPTSVAPEEGH
ncbi:hypothetical protein [Enterococcus caccae]|uniref:Uncharacterized protein n=1 Tax=Enterococcus caccae ATCC BAA-1240 TaxID=1158612 RepID=R3WE84_9ENTE|nr:hypothetical protein [Enterococcus caccae]EOL45772.1 hypothetical protein UC7_01569 [Enterococcus caccae ATCC BAA-1240]EOT60968.1 hypothetical protein I580_01870 [Enterococcus caccae ATCC BAA-1240]